MKKPITVCTVMLLSTAVFSASSFAYPQQKGQGAHLTKFINKFDTNGDKQVTKEEFDLAMEQRFKKMDADGNGVVSKEEFKQNTKASHKKMADKNKSKNARKKTQEIISAYKLIRNNNHLPLENVMTELLSNIWDHEQIDNPESLLTVSHWKNDNDPSPTITIRI